MDKTPFFCSHCRNTLAADTRFCSICGIPNPPPFTGTQEQSPVIPLHPSRVSSAAYGPLQGFYGITPDPGALPKPYSPPPPYNNPSYQQGSTYSPPSIQPGPLPLGQALAQLPRQYLKTLMRPSASRFAQEMGKASWGIVWIQLLGLALFFGVMFAFGAVLSQIEEGTRLSVSAISFSVVFVYLVIFILVLGFFFIQTGILYMFAKIVGGQGRFLNQSYTMLLFLVPSGIIIAVLALVPVFGWLFLLAWLIYCIVLDILVIKAVHGLSQGHATAVVLILPVVSLVLWVWGSPLAGQMDAASLLGRITGRFFVAFLISLFIFFLIRKTRGSKQ
jgi:hypothetical protein